MSNENLSGHIFGQYELRQLLGIGGMGAVYRAYQSNLKREVAVKVLPSGLAQEPGYIERFTREATTAAALDHPHIVAIFDYGTQRDVSYVVMRLLTGGTLAQRRAAGEPSLDEVSQLLKQMASALDYAHSEGVLHRDIKASNIMFNNHGNAFLMDFGIAKLLGADTGLTGTGVVMGTTSHMPPEQWRGLSLSPAADQYALGVVTYQLVTGRLPYIADNQASLMYKHFEEQPTPLQVFRPNLPEAITVVLERALAKKPEDRFPNITSFAQAFDKAISGVEGESTGFFTAKLPPQPPPRFNPTPISGSGSKPPSKSQPAVVTQARPAYRNPIVWGLILVIGLLAAILVALLTPRDGGGIAILATETSTQTVTGSQEATPQATLTVVNPISTIPSTNTLHPADTSTPITTITATLTATAVPSATPVPTEVPSFTPVPPTIQVEADATDDAPGFVIGDFNTRLLDAPSGSATVVELVRDVQLLIVGVTADGFFYQVDYNGQQLWVGKNWGQVQGDVDTIPVVESDETSTVVFVVGGLGAYIKDTPTAGTESVASVTNSRLPVVGVTADGEYYQIKYEGQALWVHRNWGRIEGDMDAIPVVEVNNPNQPMFVAGGLGACLKEQPSYLVQGVTVPANERLPISGITQDSMYYRVEYQGDVRWIHQLCGRVEGDVNIIPVVEVNNPNQPMFVAGGLGACLKEQPSYLVQGVTVPANERLPISGITQDSMYYRVEYQGDVRWIHQLCGRIEGDVNVIPVVESNLTELTPTITTTPLPESVRFEFDATPLGRGWSGTEIVNGTTFVWMNSRTATLRLPIQTDQSLRLQARVWLAMGSDIVRSLKLKVNDLDVELLRSENDAPTIYTATLSRAVLAGSDGAVNLTFEISRTQVADNGDTRNLGLAFDWVELSPYEPIAAVATPLPTSTPLPSTAFLGEIFSSDFESNSLIGFTTEGWRNTENDGQRMLCLNNSNNRYGDFPRLDFGRGNWRNYSVEIRIRFTGTEGHAAILTRLAVSTGFGYRHSIDFGSWGSSSGQYYYGGAGEDLGNQNTLIRANEWFVVRAEVDGSTIRSFVNGVLVATGRSTLRETGLASIEGGPQVNLCVDDLVVRSLDRSPESLAAAATSMATGAANMRTGPGTDFSRVSSVTSDEEIFIIDWNEDRTWAYIRKDETHIQGWVSADYIQTAS
jgi:serine/threonine protein kinase/uncharacterized protein YraI